MMSQKFSAVRWAIEMTKFWELASHGDRFPVNVEVIALEISKTRYSEDRLVAIEGGSLPGFEGALYPLGGPTDGWAIIYNNTGVSEGRRRFTIAHEFGHYLAHRSQLPRGVECGEKVVTRRDGKGIEKEADEFAAYLLMPFDDYKAQIAPSEKPTFDDLGRLANRYGVSLTAATLRWLEYTERRAVLVVSRDGGAIWSRSSEPAKKTGRVYWTSQETFMLPEGSVAAREAFDESGRGTAVHAAGIWFPEEVEEESIRSRRYDLCLTLLHLPKHAAYVPIIRDEPDTFDRLFDNAAPFNPRR
jgi:hypothetical protein